MSRYIKSLRPTCVLSSLLAAAIPLSDSFAQTGGDLVPSGVSTEAITLPKPAGTIQGFGAEASSVGNTGAATYSVPIELPKGRNGMQPELTLTYNSSAGQGPFGIGWSLDIPMLERSTLRGVPSYTSQDLFSSSSDGELVDLGRGIYRALIDKSQNLYQYDPASDQWTRYTANGVVETFGGTFDSRIPSGSGTFKWFITSSIDPFGNQIRYTYLQDAGQTYINQISYADLYTVQFVYEKRPDSLKSYMSSEGITTRLRCKDIWVRANSLIRHYRMVYDLTPNGKLSRLRTVQLFGTDDTTKYPDLTFTYSEEADLTTQQSTALTFDTTGVRALPPSLVNPRVNLIDLNSDGITDLLESREDGAVVWEGNGDYTFKASYSLSSLRGVLGTKNTKLLDVDGDRHVDFVGSGLYPKYWKGNGQGGFEPPQAIAHFPRYSVGSPQVKTIDVNGDGKMDLLAQEANEIWTFFNGGEGKGWNRRVKFRYGDPGTPYPVFDFSSSRTFMADMNGDGLADIAYIDLGKIYYYPNRGNGYWDMPVTMPFEGVNYSVDCPTASQCPKPPLILSYARHERSVLLMDINSDGLSDLVVVLPNAILYAYSRGDGTFSQTYTYQNVHPAAPDPRGIYITTADVNGNGTQDLIWTNDFAEARAFDFNETLKPNLLIEVRNGLGKRTELEYLPHTKFGTSPLLPEERQSKVPYAVHTVKSIKNFAWDQLTDETQFSYFGGFYEGARNEFRGFRLIERYQPGDDSVPDLIDRRFFEVGEFALHDKERGLMTEQEIRKISLSRKSRHWGIATEGPVLKGSQTQYQTLSVGTGLYGEFAGMALESVKTEIEGSDSGQTRSYDSVYTYALSDGAIRVKSTLTENDQGQPYRRIIDTFAHGIRLDGTNPILWNVGNLAQRNIEDPSGTVIQSTRFYFDHQSQFGAVTQGKITRQDKLQNGAYVTKNTYTWTADGNLATFADAAGQTTLIAYEPTFRLFPSQVTNPKGHVQLAVYDANRGVISSSRDVNENWSLYEYDPFLRLAKVLGPAKNPSTLNPAHPTLNVLYTFGNELGVPGTILTQKITDIGETTTIDSKAYFDPLGRSLGTILSGPAGKFVHTGGAEYNIRGKVKKKYLPFFVNSLDDAALNTTRPFIRTDFDILDRALLVQNPEHTPSNPSVKQHQYNVGETVTTDELGNPTVNRFDFLGRLVEVEDAKGFRTTYGYTLTDQVALIVDAKSEFTEMVYDSLDRRVCKLDPNLGKTTYSYNNLDLLVEKRDFGWDASVTSCAQTGSNPPRVTTFEYNDPLNRITLTDSNDPETAPVLYGYDSGPEGKGRLTSTTFEVGSKTLHYDIYGNVTRTDYVIDGQAGTVQEIFDVLGRLRRVVYPVVSGNTLIVDYEFDEAGNIKRAFNAATGYSYASNLTYNELNQISRIDFGNGVKTRMRYDITQGSYRLQDLVTYRGAAISDSVPLASACTGNAFQCLGYSYDKVSNITQIQDLKTAAVPFRNFQYDELNQLTQAIGLWGTQSWVIDEIGNITRKTTVPRSGGTTVDDYTYHSTRKQILTRVGTRNYGFDAFGNLSSRQPNESLFWNARNELKRFRKGNQEARYFYDENGERVARTGNLGVRSRWYGRYFEKPQSETQKRYVYVGQRRVAVVPETGNNVRYFHGDHLQSSNFVTDFNGIVRQQKEYAPYGEVVTSSGGLSDFHFGFTDKYLDDESNLNYFGARYFIPGVGRWASADPAYIGPRLKIRTDQQAVQDSAPEIFTLEIERTEAIPLWRYAQNTPVRKVDETGEQPGDVWLYKPDGNISSQAALWAGRLADASVGNQYAHSSVEITGQRQYTANLAGGAHAIESNFDILFNRNGNEPRSIDIYRHVDSSKFNATAATNFAETRTQETAGKLSDLYGICGVCSTRTKEGVQAGGIEVRGTGIVTTPDDLSRAVGFEKVGTYNTTLQRSELPNVN